MSSFKKYIGTALLICANPVFAGCEYYAGLGFGPETANFKQKSFTIGRPPATDFRVIDKNQFAGKGGFGTLFAGIAYRFANCDPCFENIYIGSEINANLRKVKYKATNEEFINVNFNHDYYQMRRDVGLSLLPGILFSECSLLYVRLGYANGRFTVDTTDSSLQNIRRNLNGFRYGLGFRQGITNDWSFRIEYSQTDYQKAKMSTFTNVQKFTSITPHTQRFEMSLVYNF